MAGTYFMGARAFTSKKGKALATADFLTMGAFGWTIVQKWVDPATVDDVYSDIPVGSPVLCQLDMAGNIIDVAINPAIPELLLDTDSL